MRSEDRPDRPRSRECLLRDLSQLALRFWCGWRSLNNPIRNVVRKSNPVLTRLSVQFVEPSNISDSFRNQLVQYVLDSNQFRSVTLCLEAVALPVLAGRGKLASKDCLLLEFLILCPQSSEPPLTSLKVRDPISAAMSYPKTFLIIYNHSVAVQLISPIHHPR